MSSTFQGADPVATPQDAESGPVENRLTLSSKVEAIEMPESIGSSDPLYLFACHLEWCRTRNLAAYQELLVAQNDTDPDIRIVAEVLLRQGLTILRK